MEGSSAPYRFDVLPQLANIPSTITLYDLLRLSKSTREALREILADSGPSWPGIWLNLRRNMKKTISTPLSMPPV